jgi:K+-transporting ATPase ATPase B chain
MKSKSTFSSRIVREAIVESFRKLSPRHQLRNPVMFIVLVCSFLTTALGIEEFARHGAAKASFTLHVSAWLWFTVLFGNFAEAMAEGRGKAQAESLRRSRRDVKAKKLDHPSYGGRFAEVAGSTLRKGDIVLAEAGDTIPMDGEVVEGAASVDESAITGESAPVIRESGGDRSSVTGGTRVLADWLVIRVTSEAGESFLERMISMVEGAKRKKTPNEIALTILLAALTIVFLLATVTLLPFSIFAVKEAGKGEPVAVSPHVARGVGGI